MFKLKIGFIVVIDYFLVKKYIVSYGLHCKVALCLKPLH